MGTRGFYVFKWQGKYYIYYNHWDSYPSGLGKQLVSQIPSDPEQYQKWLQEMRSHYSDFAKKLERLFTISMDKSGEDYSDGKDPDDDGLDEDERSRLGIPIPSIKTLTLPGRARLDALERTPGYLAPENDIWIEWIYVIDLDREIFGIQDACFFHLSKIDDDFEDLMEESQNYWLGNVSRNEVHESITTKDVQPILLTDNPTPAFLQMKPTTIYPRQESRLNRLPAFVVCKRLYEFLSRKHERHINQAQDCHIESDFLFKELVFALVCFASCSPAWIRLTSTGNIDFKQDRKSGDHTCGVILDHGAAKEPKEFVTTFLSGYHLEGMETGSAAESTSYWFSGALVYLRRDITSREKLHDAIVSAVAKGKADGHAHFNAIIVSLEHFVLLKFADGGVQHTKRLNLGACKFVREVVLEFGRDNEEEETKEPDEEDGNDEEEGTDKQEQPDVKEETKERDPPLSNETADDLSDDSDWADNADVAGFDILAHFFDATQKQGLKPSIVHNEGVFPNEVYQKILSYVDRETNVACLQVSRPFREFASETFIVDDGLKLVYRPGTEPEYFHDTVGSLGPLKSAPFRYEIREGTPLKVDTQWIPVFGRPDGSASMDSEIILAFPQPKPLT